MGNKIDTMTVEGIRKIAHDLVDSILNDTKKGEDGKPIDEVTFHQERHTEHVDAGFLATGTTVTLGVKYAHPRLVLAPDTEMFVRAPEGLFRLAYPDEARINHLVQILIAQGSLGSEADALGKLIAGRVFEIHYSISALAQHSSMIFERTSKRIAEEDEPALAPQEPPQPPAEEPPPAETTEQPTEQTETVEPEATDQTPEE